MRIAALFDIHGNLPALNAVLHDVRAARVDRVVVGGDVVPGPMCVETLARLQDLDVPTDFIRGNGEVAVTAEKRGEVPPGVPERYRPTIEWVARQLEDEQAQFIATWPMTVSLSIPGLDVLFCHATPRNEFEIFLPTTADEKLLPVFGPVREAMVVCGHSHLQFDRMVGRHRIVNAGSVGMPFGPPGADWLLLGPGGVELRHTDYDLAAAASVVRETGYPEAESFAAEYILNPPSAQKMIEAFRPAELK
jgi:predicted phosphodiesterase